MAENDKKPRLRFKGFTNSWEQRKLGELGEFKSNGVDKLSKPNEISVNLLNYMDVYNRRKVTNKNANELMHVTAKPSQVKDNNILKGDVFFTPTSETADDIGHVMVIEETLENTVYSYHLMRFRPYSNIFYTTFPNYCLDTKFTRKQMELSAQGVQRFVINRKQFEEIKTNIPSYDEQKKIADILTLIDNLITLHQRKYEKLKNIKKASLDKMFPQKNSQIPLIRFKNFTNSWEQRKLGDITFQCGERNVEDLPYESYSVSNKDGFVNQKDQFKFGGLVSIADKSRSIIVTPHTFAYNPARLDIGSIGYQNLNKNVIISPMYEIFKADNEVLNDRFLWHWLKSDIFNSIVVKNQEGGVRTCFNLPKFFQASITITQSLKEQEQIGKIFDCIDNLITLHQRKYEKLKNIKKAMMEQMFA